MTIQCQQIDSVIKLAEKHGNKVKEVVTGWTNMDKVIYMVSPMLPTLKNEVMSSVKGVRYRKNEGSVHYPDDERFICDECKVAILFPLK